MIEESFILLQDILGWDANSTSFATLRCIIHNMIFAVADPGFLERGVHMYKSVGVRCADFLKYPMKMK